MAPTGARCRDCVSNRSLHVYQVTPPQFALTFALAAVLGAGGAVLVGFVGVFWLFALLYAPALGPLLGQMVTRITNGKRGPRLAAVTIGGVIAGAATAALFTGAFLNPIFYLMLAIAAAGVWAFLK